MRSRNIKPGFLKNDVLAGADPLFQVVFAGLWCVADREGRLEDRPARIHAEVNPYRELAGTKAALDWLVVHGFIVRYTVAGEPFIWIPKFARHQNPHMREAPSRLPPCLEPEDLSDVTRAPDEHSASTVLAPEKAVLSPADSGFPLPDPGYLKTDSGSPIPDSPLAATWKRALEAARDPRHANMTCNDLAQIARCTVEIAKKARRQVRTR